MRIIWAVVLSLFLILGSGMANAQPARVALIIGNSEYSVLPLLPNPVDETGRVAVALRNTGFRVTHVTNQSLSGLRASLASFSEATQSLPTGSIALVYFAGHGLSFRNKNYVVPVGTAPLTAENLGSEAFSLEDLIAYMPRNTRTASIVVIDACRSIPEGARDPRLNYGFVRSGPPVNGILAFSASEGRDSFDGAPGIGSPYSNAFITMLQGLPGADVEYFFRQIRRSVVIVTESGQIPVEHSGLLSTVSLSGDAMTTRDRRTAAARDFIDNGDAAEGVPMAERSAREGDLNAMRIVSSAYRQGHGVTANVERSLEWARRAAELGHDDDKAYWADFVISTPGRPSREVEEARRELARLLAVNNSDANFFIARQHQRRGGPIRARTTNSELTQAAEFWRRSALLGSGSAAVNLGFMFQMGWGVPQDNADAARWYRRAADAGIPRGMTRLGVVLTTFGTRTRSSGRDAEAVAWLRRAATAGDVEAKYWLSLFTYAGIGITREPAQAIQLMVEAIGNGVQPGTGVSASAPEFLDAMRRGWAFREPLLDETKVGLIDSGGFLDPSR